MTWLTTTSNTRAGLKRMIRAAAAVCAVACFSSNAQAEVGQPKADAGAKATVGLAMLGAETVLTVEAIVGVKPWWGYAIGGGVGAVAGGVGGYFIDKGNKNGVSMGILVGGMVLAVPTALAVLSATAYKPPKNPEVDAALLDRDLAMMQSIVERHALAHYQAPPSFLNVAQTGQVRLQMPAVNIQPVYELKYRQIVHLPDAASVRVPVVNLSF